MGGMNQTEISRRSTEISKDCESGSQTSNYGVSQLEKSLGYVYINKTEYYAGTIEYISKVAANTIVCFESNQRIFWCSGEDLTQNFQVGDEVEIYYKVIVAYSYNESWIISIEKKKD